MGEFYAHPHSVDGRMGVCKDCHKARIKQNREDKKEYYLEYDRNRYYEHGYRYKNYNVTDYVRMWRQQTGKMQEYSHKRRVLIESAGGNFTIEEFQEMCEAYGWVCLCCGEECESLTVDHVKPVSKGGANDIGNIQPLCGSCNSSKSTREVDYR